MKHWGVGGFAFIVLLSSQASTTAKNPDDFNRQVAPILIRHCAACHNPGDLAGGLNLLDANGLMAGGDSAEPAVISGNADDSPLFYRIEAVEMPPKEQNNPVSAEDLAILKAWIESGATWPEGRVLSPFEFTTDSRAGLDWWSLQPPVRPNVPNVGNERAHAEVPQPTTRVRNPIDHFVAAKLFENGLQLSPDANRATLIRRAMLDLHGLPPTPEQVQEFVADPDPAAYEKLIDRLLASPRYGEHWARHWLDVVGFAESAGFETNLERPNAWPYRDYVIEAFNSDKPYTQFIIEQLAGDQYGEDVATSFLVAGPNDVVTSPDIELTRAQRLGELNDMVSTTAMTFLGLSAGCAKCHDHKFDPISQVDYYAMQAIFSGVRHGERMIESDENDEIVLRREQLQQELLAVQLAAGNMVAQAQPLAVVEGTDETPRRVQVTSRNNIDRFAPTAAKFVRITIRATNNLEPCIDELEVFTTETTPRNVALASVGAVATSSGVFANGTQPIHQLKHINDGLYGNARSWISDEVGKGWVQIELPELATIDRIVWARDREGVFQDRTAVDYVIEVADAKNYWHVVATGDDRQPFDGNELESKTVLESLPEEVRDEFQALQAKMDSIRSALEKLEPQMVYAGTFAEPSEPTYRLHRGEPMQRREEISPGTIAAVGQPLPIDNSTPETKRRLALAEWIASAENPLTARVMVNRIWHHHFGRGLLLNPSDFGFHGGKPSHPELLDWLATEFIAGDWRPKHLHRQIMLSSTYRQSSQNDPCAAAIDGDNLLLWRFRPRRLEAGPIRDTILAVAGTLDLTMGGPGFEVFEPNGNYVKVYTPKTTFGPPEWRRAIYMEQPRMQRDATFGAFDCPDFAQSIGKRDHSTTALQALSLLNSPFMIQQAEKFAERLAREAPESIAAQVERAFWLAFGRAPDASEKRAAEKLVASEGLPIFCRAILNSNELIYLQ